MVLNKFRLSDIVSATKNFATECCIGVGAYGMMYNAKLDHYDTKSLSEIEGNNGGELRKETDNVTLKRILNREDRHGKQGFFEEIDLLSSFKHPNILSLLGISSENRELIVIYKGDLKGSLHDCLRNLRTMAKLTWAKRIQISLDIAHGVNYLQTSAEDKQRIMQFDVNSANILLDAKWRAKIACFWLSTLNSASVDAGKMQLYPEYIKIEKLKKESEIYSLGVILFEILCGRLQYDEIYYAENEKGLPVMARRCFDEGTILNKMIDPNLKEEIDENICILNEEVNEDSFNVFLKIAYGCCALSEADRPSMKAILEELEKALNIQAEHLEGMKAQIVEKKKTLEHLKIPLINISLATENFSESYLIGVGGYGGVYKAELYNFSGMTIEEKINSVFPKRHIAVAIKRVTYRGDAYVEQGFMAELEILSQCNHPNIVSLIGFCDEDQEKILVLEYVSNRSLADYLKDLDNKPNLTWDQRLQICLDIACGICYLHSSTEDKQTIIHRDIKSENILLSENMVAKICDFGLSKLNHAYQQFSSVHTNHIAGTQMYLDPDYGRTGRLKKESDIYSFGVVLLEILCGKVAYDHAFMSEAANGLAQVARKCFKNGTIKQIIDSRMKEDDEINFRLNGEVPISQDSLDTFSKIAYQCLAKSQNQRPTMQTVIAELKKARYFQTHKRDKLQVLPKDIQLMTENFSDHKCTGEGGYWKRYKGELVTANGCITVVAKRFDSKYDKQRQHFLKELEILFKCKHDNIVSLVGYCQYMDEKIIVYEHPSNGRLSEHLDNANITWMKRLKISIDVACGLQFLHTFGVIADIPIIHGTIKSASILLDDVWVAKLSDLELSLNSLDDGYEQSGYLKQRLDIYSLGVVLLELLCGKFAWVEGNEDQSHSLVPLAKQCFKKGKLDELVFEGIKEQINSSSLETYVAIALRCLKDDGDERPEASEVLIQLQKAAELQEDFDIWEPKLPKDYQEIIRFSEMDNNAMKKDIYNKLRKGLLLRDREVCLSLGTGGERHYMISAKKFSYKNRWALNWRRIPESRFGNAAEMSNLSNLKIKINIRTLFLSLGVNYGVHLIFRFFGPRKITSKLMYVNLMYKIGSDTFRAYFATWRDEEWMKIELCRFVYNQEDTNFEVLLENFSSYYCGRGAVYIEGIEFRVIDKVNGKEIEKTNEVQQVFKLKSDGDDQVQQLPSDSDEILRSSPDSKPKKLISQNEVNIKKQFMLSAKEVLHDSSNVKHFHLKHSSESRFQEVIELLPQQVLRINCKIQSQMFSKDTEYSCYLVFKLSEKCLGLHCPVKVRALPCRKRKEAKHIYFRSPNPWNLHNDIHCPRQREDGWMEVNVWNIHKNHKLQNDCFWVNLKLTSYEGTMAGLIVCGLEFRPM